jgi:hypothetical protein
VPMSKCALKKRGLTRFLKEYAGAAPSNKRV